MNKKNYERFTEIIGQVEVLKNIERIKWNQPISDGKWSIREIMGHLYFWDKFILETMLPKISDGAHLPKFPDNNMYNQKAIKYIEQYNQHESIINEFIQTRRELADGLNAIPNEARFTITADSSIYSIDSFVRMFIEHDAHHLKQINSYLQK